MTSINDRRAKKLGFYNFQQLKRRNTVEATKQMLEIIKRRKADEKQLKSGEAFQSNATLATEQVKLNAYESATNTSRVQSTLPSSKTETTEVTVKQEVKPRIAIINKIKQSVTPRVNEFKVQVASES